MKVFHEFKPVYTKDAKILILGSIPSIKSRELGFYYMNKTNRFWQVLEKVFNEKITNKIEFLNKHYIALWDVCSSCTIKNSSDSSIKDVKVNDIPKILSETKIKYIYTTGKKAGELYEKYIYPKTKIKAIVLPSTSSANAKWKLYDLVLAYQIIKEGLNE